MKLHLFWSMGMKQKIVSLSPIETVCKLFLAVKLNALKLCLVHIYKCSLAVKWIFDHIFNYLSNLMMIKLFTKHCKCIANEENLIANEEKLYQMYRKLYARKFTMWFDANDVVLD